MITFKMPRSKTSSEFYQLSINKPAGEAFHFNELIGKTVLIVNTATKCGLTPQLKSLEKIHQKHQDQGLIILGFPCNQFMFQEPETNESVEVTCLVKYGVTFQLTEKIKVNGPNTHPIFKFLKRELPDFWGGSIKWNFTKFLISPSGIPFRRYKPSTLPEHIEKDIQKLLKRSNLPS
jgi:glutathione peroxidase